MKGEIGVDVTVIGRLWPPSFRVKLDAVSPLTSAPAASVTVTLTRTPGQADVSTWSIASR